MAQQITGQYLGLRPSFSRSFVQNERGTAERWHVAIKRDALFALVKAVDAKDGVTGAHTARVTLYAQALAEAAGLKRSDIYRVMRAAVLHDIGKIDIPSTILTKPGRLTDREYAVIKTHTVLGYKRLVRMGATDPMLLAVIRSHHEHVDGSGYPDGLIGDQIHPAARCFAVIDAFDAMTSIRPYHRRIGPNAGDRAIEELNRYVGTWYCPEAVESLTLLYEAGKLNWIMRHHNDEETLSNPHCTCRGHHIPSVREFPDMVGDTASLQVMPRVVQGEPKLVAAGT